MIFSADEILLLTHRLPLASGDARVRLSARSSASIPIVQLIHRSVALRFNPKITAFDVGELLQRFHSVAPVQFGSKLSCGDASGCASNAFSMHDDANNAAHILHNPINSDN